MFVYLVLAAQYESWSIPFSVILAVPMGLLGAMVFTIAAGRMMFAEEPPLREIFGAFARRLPAYLVADLEGTLLTGDPTTRLCAFVTPLMENKRLAKFYGGGTLGEHARREFALFDAAQVAAIVAYLWWKLDEAGYDPTVEQALENYWLPREAEVSDAGRD